MSSSTKKKQRKRATEASVTAAAMGEPASAQRQLLFDNDNDKPEEEAAASAAAAKKARKAKRQAELRAEKAAAAKAAAAEAAAADAATESDEEGEGVGGQAPGAVSALRQALIDADQAAGGVFEAAELQIISPLYTALRSKLDRLLGITSTPSSTPAKSVRGGSDGGSGTKASAASAATVTTAEKHAATMKDIDDEVRRLIAMQGVSSFKDRVRELVEYIRDALSSNNINFEHKSITSIDGCDEQLQRVALVERKTLKLLLALRIHQGHLWLRQQELAEEEFAAGRTVTWIVNSKAETCSDIKKFRVIQQEKYFAARENIQRSITLAHISKTFPEILDSEKSWSWFRAAITHDKLQDAIKRAQASC
jgi:hypothetical protein